MLGPHVLLTCLPACLPHQPLPPPPLQGIVKKFFNEKEVTSTLVMDALYSGCKQIEEATRGWEQVGVVVRMCAGLHSSLGRGTHLPVLATARDWCRGIASSWHAQPGGSRCCLSGARCSPQPHDQHVACFCCLQLRAWSHQHAACAPCTLPHQVLPSCHHPRACSARRATPACWWMRSATPSAWAQPSRT